jgi:FKBP-type peptidyl-prolyl cis-trans isomerase
MNSIFLGISSFHSLLFCESDKQAFEKNPTKAEGTMTGGKKKSKSTSIGEKDHTKINDEIVVDTGAERPKSKKELRLERKAAKKKIADQKTASMPKKETKAKTETKSETNVGESSSLLEKEEYTQLKKLQKAELKKEREKLLQKELREEKKHRKQKRLNRELNAKGGAKKKQKTAALVGQQSNASAATGNASSSSKKKKVGKVRDERDVSMDAFRSVLYGTGSSATVGGMTTSRLGVQYEDKVVGTGKLVRDGKALTVKYELTGGRFGAVIDSSRNFTFRTGMGEVIQGWDIGLEGMREGGRRKLVIPPKAGYGGKDIGAGPGGLLYFDITLIACER